MFTSKKMNETLHTGVLENAGSKNFNKLARKVNVFRQIGLSS